jgi:hypothetical protein
MRPLWVYHGNRPLPRDFRKAVEELEKHEEHWSGRSASPTPVTASSWQQGAVTSFSRRLLVKEIPGGITWRWNQTRAKTTLTNTDGSSLMVTKLCPRKKLTTGKSPDYQSIVEVAPSYKLWLFELKGSAVTGYLSVLWCEAGGEEEAMSGVPTNTGLTWEFIDAPGCPSIEWNLEGLLATLE